MDGGGGELHGDELNTTATSGDDGNGGRRGRRCGRGGRCVGGSVYFLSMVLVLQLQLQSCVDCSCHVKEEVAGGGGTGAQHVGNGSQPGATAIIALARCNKDALDNIKSGVRVL